MKKLMISALVGASLLISACNTVEGAGKDLQSAGEAVEDVEDVEDVAD